jgi:hypothetical protein
VNRIPVTSTNIKSIGYDRKTATIEVEFQSGGIYQYDCFPEKYYYDFLNAPSKGTYFYENIKDKYKTYKIS